MSPVLDRASEIAMLREGIASREAARAAARAAFESAVGDISKAEADIATYRTALAEAERDLSLEARAAEAREQQLTEAASYTERFSAIAAGKPWYEGTGNDDAILPHQWQAAQFGAVARRWLLGDGVGLGKTRTTTAWLDLVGAKRVIIICEPNIVNQFAGEVATLAPHRTVVNLYKRTPAMRHHLLDTLPAEAVIVCNFEIWRRDKDALAKMIGWQADTVIVDEAHNLKSTATANFRYVKTLIAVDNVCPECGSVMFGLVDEHKRHIPCAACGWTNGKTRSRRYANKYEHVMSTRSVKNLCLTTGTPILNEPGDLYSLLHLINPLLFTTRASFEREYLTIHGPSQKFIFKAGALTRLKPMLADMMLARTREDAGITLPPQHVNVWPVSLDGYDEQRAVIQAITKEAVVRLTSGEEASIMHVMALMTRKRQANVFPGGIVIRNDMDEVVLDASSITESAKLDEVVEHAVSLKAESHQVQVVFSQFKTALAELEQRLTAKGLRVARFDGDTPRKVRDEIRANLDRTKGQAPKWDIVLANYKTAGTGLNLTAATVTHILDEEWGPGKRDQAYGRTRRMGQTEETQVFVYRIPGTIDTWLSNTINRKEALIEGFKEGTSKVTDLAADLRRALTNGEIL